MKKFLLACFLVSGSLYAQQPSSPDKTIKLDASCSTQERVTAMLKQFEEIPMLGMVSERQINDGKVMSFATIMFVNPNTKTYTVVEQFTEEIYCVTVVGKNVTPMIDSIKKPKESPSVAPKKL